MNPPPSAFTNRPLHAGSARSMRVLMLKKVLLAVGGALLLAVVVVLLIATTQPDTFKVERHAVIPAPASAIFPNLADFHRWEAWSPWEKLDPNMKKTYAGPPTGPGSSYAWHGNDDVGQGKMTVLESRPDEHLAIKLEFLEPFAATNTTTYTLVPEAGGTRVTWAMEGANSFAGKLFSVFADMDAMVGKDFETGLANLARVSTAAPTAAK